MTQDFRGSRLPYLRYEDLDARGQEVWDGVTGSRGGEVVNADGGLIGPFNAFVHAPGVGKHLSALGGRLRFRTSIERRLLELAIITVGAAWKAEFEWWAHARMAREHGVSDAVVEAIGIGDDPPFTADDERVIYTVARQLTGTGRLGQDDYDAAQGLLGDAGMVELVSVCGYYTLISYLLNAFDVPLPPGERPQWHAPTTRQLRRGAVVAAADSFDS
jgi:4-carboxymuconolactone decarboxylase